MCGIVGIVYRNPQTLADRDRLNAARDQLIHRGPDEAGDWIRPGVAFAHRRLKILDLTHGQQPMASRDDRFALIYNGEIYNFRELRETYEQSGATFQSQCDTEVLFHALNHHRNEPTRALDQLNGMFAFAHWDDRERRLLLARDRLGQKPLYWFADRDRIAFASELKALLALLDEQFDLDPVAIDQFFARGYVLSPRTIFRGIQKLPAGCALHFDADPERWQYRVQPYWDVQPVETPNDDKAALDELEALLADSVEKRLISDVPIGCLLSGGIDSSLITAFASRVTDSPIEAFSIGFEESEQLNELPYAEIVARHFGCNWHRRSMQCDDFADSLDKTARYFDEPYGNFTMFSMRRLAQIAREELTVVLSGQGGDELTAGYPGRYNWVQQTEQQAQNQKQRSAYAPPVDDVVHHLNHTSFVPWPNARERVLSSGLKDAIQSEATAFDCLLPFWTRRDPTDRLNRVLYTDVKSNLPDYLVCLEERMTMSTSLEARNPFLDHRVVNYCLSLPAQMKIRNGDNKWILKTLALRHIPREAIDRPKRGFTPPLQHWIQQGAAQLQAIFNESAATVGGLYSNDWRNYLAAGRYTAQTTMPVFYSLMFALWAKHYGQYVRAWPSASNHIEPATTDLPLPPGEGQGAGEPRTTARLTTNSPWHRTLRHQTAEAKAIARWFCQALNNFKPGDRIQLCGDPDGWYAYLAESSGLRVASNDPTKIEPIDGAIFIDEDAITNCNATLGTIATNAKAQALLFLPFDAKNQQQVQVLISRIASEHQLAGSQGVPVSQTKAVLIARINLAGANAESIHLAG